MPRFIAKNTVAAFVFLSAVPFVTAASAQEIASLPQCDQKIADTLAAKDENPDAGEKAETLFAQLIEQARQQCAANDYRHAADTLNQARTMVAAE